MFYLVAALTLTNLSSIAAFRSSSTFLRTHYSRLAAASLLSLTNSPLLSNKSHICSLTTKLHCETPTNYLRVDSKAMASLEPITSPPPTEAEKTHLLPYTEDRYDGVIVNSKMLPSTEEEFVKMLQFSMQKWKAAKRRGVWIKLPLDKASFVPIAAKEGFHYHHAEKDYVMMTAWLPEEGECRLPPNASHQVGVGCLVVHQGKILLVQEKNGPLRGTGVWKLPTGLVEAGEDITKASEREVFEETGINAKFKKLLAFRQAHNALFGKSDLFFVCVLEPESFEICPQEVEIHAADWKEPEALFEQRFFQQSPLHTLLNSKIKLEIMSKLGQVSSPEPGLVQRKLPLGFRPGESSLYFFDSEGSIIEDCEQK